MNHPPVRPPYWWACQWPERKPDFDVIAHPECSACQIAKEAASRTLCAFWHRIPTPVDA